MSATEQRFWLVRNPRWVPGKWQVTTSQAEADWPSDNEWIVEEVVPASLLAEVEAERDENEGALIAWRRRCTAAEDALARLIDPKVICAAAEEVRGVIGQLYAGSLRIDEIQPGSLAEDVLRTALDTVNSASPNGSTAGSDTARPRSVSGRASQLDEVGDFVSGPGIELVRDAESQFAAEGFEATKRRVVEAVEDYRSYVESSSTVLDLVGDVLDTYDDSERERDAELAVDEERIDREERGA